MKSAAALKACSMIQSEPGLGTRSKLGFTAVELPLAAIPPEPVEVGLRRSGS